jgi:putative ABC transport system permease protein
LPPLRHYNLKTLIKQAKVFGRAAFFCFARGGYGGAKPDVIPCGAAKIAARGCRPPCADAPLLAIIALLEVYMNILLAVQGAVSQGVLWGIMAVGVFITFKVLDFPDLTVDGSFALGGSVSAVLIVGGMNPLLSLGIAFAAGAGAGIVTGILHTKLKIPGILAGILSMIALYSVNIRVMGRANTPLLGITTLMSRIRDGAGLSITAASLIAGAVFCAVIIGALYWFFGTELGSAIRATGSNEKMIRALGVDTDKMKITGLLLSNAFVALSGALVAQSQGFGDVQMGVGAIVIGLASIIIGEVFFGWARPFWAKLLACVFGSIIYRIIIATVLQLGLKSTDLKLLTAVIVAIALSIPVFKQRYAKAPPAVEDEEADL